MAEKKKTSDKNKKTNNTQNKKNITTEAFIKGKIGEIVNEVANKAPANEFVVVTKEDNLVHNYFHACETYWDSNDCLSRIKLKFPKAKEEETKYWINYKGDIWCYMGNNISLRNVTNIGEYNIEDIESPFFVGTVNMVKESYQEIEIPVNNIGERFKQAIPDQFRQQYINNQNVRDAFQAICEFLGVYYICPPKQENDSGVSDNNPNENDPNDTSKREQNTAKDIKNSAKKTIKDSKNQENNNQDNNQDNSNNQNNNENQDNENNDENTDTNNTTNSNTQMPMQGYDQVNFDANGAITYNNVVIEESPDISETLINMEDTVYDRYVEDETEVFKDVTDFLNGKIFEEIHPNYMDYNAITIEPKASSSSSMSEIDSGQNSDQNNDQNSEQDSSQDGNNDSKNGINQQRTKNNN